MRAAFFRTLKLAVLGLSIAGAATPAHSVIFNISATDSVGTLASLTAGKTYLLKWIGIADGGLYDSANVQLNCATLCTTGFSNAFTDRDSVFNPLDFELRIFTTGQVYATAAESLAAYKAGDNILDLETRVVNGLPVSTINNGFLPNPAIFVAEGGAVRLFVLDTDGDRTNNTGGVSLSIEEFAAVPEPATWVMMISGFGLLGAAARNRRATLLRS